MQQTEPSSTRWISVREAAALAGVCRQTVRTWIAQGRVPALETDDGYLIDAAALRDFLVLRRAAFLAGVNIATLEQWADGPSSA